MAKGKWPDLKMRIPSDDFIFRVDEEEYRPHAGEHVIMRRKISAYGYAVTVNFARLVAEGVTAEGDVDAAQSFADALMETAEVLADQIISWTWTDEEGELYPEPHGNPKVLAQLHLQELLWLVGRYHQQGAVSKKQDGESSDT